MTKGIVTRFQCVICGKITSGRKPHAWWDGNTDYRYPRRHKVNGQPCKGNLLEAEWVDVPIKQ